MLRKLCLVGLVLCVGRGTVAQLSVAIVLSFAFFALHMYTWPYKILQDNVRRNMSVSEHNVPLSVSASLYLPSSLCCLSLCLVLFCVLISASLTSDCFHAVGVARRNRIPLLHRHHHCTHFEEQNTAAIRDGV